MRPSTSRVRGGRVGSISIAELGKAPFLLYPKRSNMRLIIDRFFKEIEVTPRVLMEADDTEAIKGVGGVWIRIRDSARTCTEGAVRVLP